MAPFIFLPIFAIKNKQTAYESVHKTMPIVKVSKLL